MPVEFVFEGETLTLATPEEFRTAVMHGRCVSRKDGISTYVYRGRKYLLSKNDLRALTSGEGGKSDG